MPFSLFPLPIRLAASVSHISWWLFTHALLVEDNALVASVIRTGLRLHGFMGDHVETIQPANNELQTARLVLAIFDFELPDDDGMVLQRRVIGTGATLPILVLTARGTWHVARDTRQDKVTSLPGGVDNYL